MYLLMLFITHFDDLRDIFPDEYFSFSQIYWKSKVKHDRCFLQIMASAIVS